MKIDRLETHDRLLQLKKEQLDPIAQGAEDCLKKNPLSLFLQEHSPYIYIFAHPRTMEDGVTKKMLWQARLTKPTSQTNSYLFRAISKSDLIEVVWLLPPRELWDQYKKGNVCESQDVEISIENFLYHRDALDRPPEDDLNDTQVRKIYLDYAKKSGKLMVVR